MLFELIDLEYQYADGTPALDRLNLCLAGGNSIALLGANGSGKSTLLRLLCGLYEPTRGEVHYQRQNIHAANFQQGEFRRAVGFVFQNTDAQLFNASVLEEVAFGPRQLGLSDAASQQRAHETLEFLGIAHLADRAPFRLSGGEKRKVAIASVLSMNPDVLLFDEPFLGLDPRSQSWLVRTINQLQSVGTTTIIATHTLDMVPRIAQSVLILGEDHRVLDLGSVERVLANPELLIQANLIEAPLELAPR